MLSGSDRSFVWDHAFDYAYREDAPAAQYAKWYLDEYGDRFIEDLPPHTIAFPRWNASLPAK